MRNHKNSQFVASIDSIEPSNITKNRMLGKIREKAEAMSDPRDIKPNTNNAIVLHGKEQNNSSLRRACMKWAAIAACFVLIVSTMAIIANRTTPFDRAEQESETGKVNTESNISRTELTDQGISDSTFSSMQEEPNTSNETPYLFIGEIVSIEWGDFVLLDPSEEIAGEEPEDHHFESDNLDSFLEFVDNDGETHPWGNERSPLWRDYEDNKEFLNWLRGETRIPIPTVLEDGYGVTWCQVGNKLPINYSFYIENDSDSLVTISFVFIPEEKRSLSLEELMNYVLTDSQKSHFSQAETRRGVCQFGNCLLFGRHLIHYETESGTFTSMSYPVISFKYRDYVVLVANRRQPETDQWDMSFLDIITISDHKTGRE